ncbi:hypothetical protein TUN205_08189 [Pyrenophora tritici-repentis]|nr:hypothetical protein TUN205_08189 [Pyrenophora tritici-repentis]
MPLSFPALQKIQPLPAPHPPTHSSSKHTFTTPPPYHNITSYFPISFIFTPFTITMTFYFSDSLG